MCDVAWNFSELGRWLWARGKHDPRNGNSRKRLRPPQSWRLRDSDINSGAFADFGSPGTSATHCPTCPDLSFQTLWVLLSDLALGPSS